MSKTAVYADSQRESIEEVINNYLPLVKKIGLHLVARLPKHVELDDLLQVGALGLIQARESFDPTRGASFATYAGIRIRGAMLDEVRRNNWAPRSIQQKMKLVSDAIKRVEAELKRSASDVEIASGLEISLEEYHELSREIACSRMISLEDTESMNWDDGLDPFLRLEDLAFRQALNKAIESLPSREMLVMSLYYGDELNLKEIGEVLGLSASRVSQMHGQALARVRARISEWVE